VEGDDMTEPIADETRSILDGHIILSRKLAQKNHYPAIDILQSVSRCQNAIIDENHKRHSAKLRGLLAKYDEVELLLKIGEYRRGADRDTDESIDKNEAINAFLRQGLAECSTFGDTLMKLQGAVN
jgi:type III secretion protein N (ATPase)